MARVETWFNQDLKEAVKVHYIDGNVFSQDNNGNVIGVRVFSDGQAAALSGTVAASIIRADGATVAANGTLVGNMASIVLPQAAYYVPGVLSVVIKLTSGSDITTLCAVVANVYMSSTDSIVDPGTIIPSIDALIAEIDAAVASIPPDYSELTAKVGKIQDSLNINVFSDNLYTIKDVTVGRLQTTGGTTADYPGFFQTGYIPVTAGKRYTGNNLRTWVLWFNSAKTLIGATASGDYTVFATAPTNAVYARFIATVDEISTLYICEIKDGIEIKVADVETITGDKTAFMQPRNVFDRNAENMVGSYITTDGVTIVTDWRFGMTDKIYATPGDIYKINSISTFVLFYDNSDAFVSYETLNNIHTYNGDVYFTIPTGVAYFRFCFLTGAYHNLRIQNLSNVDGYVLPANNASFSKEKNLFEQTPGVLYGKYRSSEDGYTIIDAPTLGMTDFIPVSQGMMYTSNVRSVFINWYGIDKRFIGITPSSDYKESAVGAVALNNAAFACFLFTMNDIDGFYVKNLTDPEFVIQTEQTNAGVADYNEKQFDGKTWVSFGDSITYQNKWQPPIATLLGLESVNCGVGSTSLSGPNINGSESLASFWKETRLNAVKNANPDIITILGGANDLVNIYEGNTTIGDSSEFSKAMPSDASASESATEYSDSSDYSVGDYCKHDGGLFECITAISGGEAWDAAHWRAVKNVDTFTGAYSYIIENLLMWKGTVSIVILGTTWAHNDGASYTNLATYTEFSNACRMVAQYYGLPFVDLHGKAGFNKYTMGNGQYAIYSSDQIHPNEEGAKRITKLVLDVFTNEVTVN